MSDLPPPPASPANQEGLHRPAPKTPHGGLLMWASAAAIIALIAGVVAAGFLWLEPVADNGPSPVTSPSPVTDIVDQKLLDQKAAIAMAYLMKGMYQAVPYVADDLQTVSPACDIQYGYAVTTTKAKWLENRGKAKDYIRSLGEEDIYSLVTERVTLDGERRGFILVLAKNCEPAA